MQHTAAAAEVTFNQRSVGEPATIPDFTGKSGGPFKK